MKTNTTVLIADDHPIFRRGLIEIIEENNKFQVISEVDDGEKALSALRSKRPAVAVLDINMPNLGGLDVLAATSRWGERPHFVILTMYNDEAYLRKALEFGAIGYLLKDNAESELIACLEAVQYGCHYISPSISGALACYNNKEGKYLERLTATERKIYLLISEYKSNAAIAVLLALSIRTVENHRSNICKKLNLKGYNALIKFASENH